MTHVGTKNHYLRSESAPKPGQICEPIYSRVEKTMRPYLKEPLGLWLAETEGAKFWLTVEEAEQKPAPFAELWNAQLHRIIYRLGPCS